MKIVNGKKFYAADIKAARRIDGNCMSFHVGRRCRFMKLFEWRNAT